MKPFQTLFFLLLIFLSSTAFSQDRIKIGEDKKLIAISESNGEMTIAYQDLKLLEKGKASFFILGGDDKWGPFDSMEEGTMDLGESTRNYTQDALSYFIVSEKGKAYVIVGKFKLGPFNSPELLKIYDGRALVANASEEGIHYEIFNLSGKSPKREVKSTLYEDLVTGIYVSDDMDVLVACDDGSMNAGHYFVYEGKKTDGFYHAVHFHGWMNTKENGFEPVFECVAPLEHEMYDVTNDLYVGNRLIEKIVAVLYDFSFNADHSDFIVKGYTADKDGARVYSSKTTLGPYESVSNLNYDSQNRVTFEFEEDGKNYLFENNAKVSIPDSEEYDWKNIAPNGEDYVMRVSGEDGKDSYYFNDRLILTGEMWNIHLVTWTKNHGPVMFESVTKPAPQNPDPNGEPWYGEVPDGFRLNINGESTKNYPSILDFKESPNGEIAYVAYENDGFYVFRGDQKYGPYVTIYAIGKERENFLKWSEDGNDLYYAAIADGQSVICKNGRSIRAYNGVITFYWNQALSSSAVVQINDMKCFLESDFYSDPLDRDPFADQQEEMFQSEFAERREELMKIDNCNSIHFNGKKYDGLKFIREVQFSKDGKSLSFLDIDDMKLIHNDALVNGTIYNDKVVYYDGDSVVIVKK